MEPAERKNQGEEEPVASVSASCEAVEDARVSRYEGVLVPRPSVPKELLMPEDEAVVKPVPLKKTIWFEVRVVTPVPPFATPKVPLKAMDGETVPTTVKEVQLMFPVHDAEEVATD